MTWQSGFIYELGLDGYGYIVNHDNPAFSHPFNISKLNNEKVRRKLLEGAPVRYQLIDHQIAKVELAPAPSN
jgi:hypothetical protein